MRKDSYIEMGAGFDICPGCGQKVYAGAMRCARCGTSLLTLEEQIERIERLKNQKKPTNIRGRVIKTLFLLSIAGIVYYFFSDQILEAVHMFLRR